MTNSIDHIPKTKIKNKKLVDESVLRSKLKLLVHSACLIVVCLFDSREEAFEHITKPNKLAYKNTFL